jgi:hypothetical protein
MIKKNSMPLSLSAVNFRETGGTIEKIKMMTIKIVTLI